MDSNLIAYCRDCKEKVNLMIPNYYGYRCNKCFNYIDPFKTQRRIKYGLLSLIILIFLTLFLVNVHADTITANVDTQHTIGTIRGDFYGVNTHGRFLTNDSWIGTTQGSTTPTERGNWTWHQTLMNQSGIKYFRGDAYWERTAINTTTFYEIDGNRYNNSLMMKNTVKYAHDLGGKVLLITGRMPSWLQNQSSPYCNSTDYFSCPPNSYSNLSSLTINYINYITWNGLYNDTLEVEVLNEPYLKGSFLNNLSDDNSARVAEYLKIYNTTYWAIKNVYPNMPVGAPASHMFYKNMMNGFLQNGTRWGYSWDFISYHAYSAYGWLADSDAIDDDDYKALEHLYQNCSAYGVNCNRVVISEYGIKNKTMTNETTLNSNYSVNIAYNYMRFLNNYPANVSLVYYQWSEMFNFTNSIFPDGTYKYQMVFEPKLGNEINPSYNITKLFATNHKAGNTVYNSSTSRSDLKMVVSKDTSKYYITLTNTNSSSNLVQVTGFGTNKLLKDVETNTIYPMNAQGIATYNISGYGVKTFVVEDNSVSAMFTQKIGDVRVDFYGTGMLSTTLSNVSVIDTNNDKVIDSIGNWTWNRERLLQSGINKIRVDMSLDYISYPNITFKTNVNSTISNMLAHKDLVKWAYENNITIIYIASLMPSWLNDTSQNCSTTIYTCPPTNYDVWGNLTQSFITEASWNGIYNSSLEVEVWNEVDHKNFWMYDASRLVEQDKVISNYIKLYNSTRVWIKAKYPNMKVGGPAVSNINAMDTTSIGKNLTLAWLKNFTTNIDFLSLHIYESGLPSVYYSDMLTYINYTNILCNLSGITCPTIYVDEWNVYNATIQNTTTYFNQYSMGVSSAYSYLLTNPSNIVSMMYTWTTIRKYAANDSSYPYNFKLVSEPLLDNSLNIPYNLTKAYTRYAPALSSIYNNTISNNTYLKVVSDKIGSTCNLILTNTYSDSMNVTVNYDSSCGTLIDTNTGQLISNGGYDAFEAFGVHYLTTLNASYNGTFYKRNYLKEFIGTGNEFNLTKINLTTSQYFYHFSSTFNSSLDNLSVSFDCNLIKGNVYWKPNGETASKVSYTCVNNLLTVKNVHVNPSTSSNELIIDYSNQKQALSPICANMFESYSTFTGFLGILFVIGIFTFLMSLVGGIIMLVMTMRNTEIQVNYTFLVSFILGLIIISFLVIIFTIFTANICLA